MNHHSHSTLCSQGSACEILQHNYSRMCMQPSDFTSYDTRKAWRLGPTLNSVTVVTHHPPTLSHHTHSHNSHTLIPQFIKHCTSVLQSKYGSVWMGGYLHPPQILSHISFSAVLCSAIQTPGSGVRTTGYNLLLKSRHPHTYSTIRFSDSCNTKHR